MVFVLKSSCEEVKFVKVSDLLYEIVTKRNSSNSVGYVSRHHEGWCVTDINGDLYPGVEADYYSYRWGAAAQLGVIKI